MLATHLAEETIGRVSLGILSLAGFILAAAAVLLTAFAPPTGFADQPFLLAGLTTTFATAGALAS